MKRYMPLITVLFVVLLMTITNPNKQAYNGWLKEKYIEQTQSDIGKGIAALFGDTIIDSTTKSKDFIILTYYNTEFDSNKIKVIGVFKNFIPIRFTEKDFSFYFYLILGSIAIAAFMNIILSAEEPKEEINEKKM